jgi:plastocyanin
MVQWGKGETARRNGTSVVRRIMIRVACGFMIACAFSGVVRAAEVGAGVTNAEPSVVKIDNFTFSPATLTVAPGTTVTWSNGDDIPHTVVGKGKGFRSKPLDTGDQFSFVFATPGEYAYFCSLHPHMVGKIIVKAADSGGATH